MADLTEAAAKKIAILTAALLILYLVVRRIISSVGPGVDSFLSDLEDLVKADPDSDQELQERLDRLEQTGEEHRSGFQEVTDSVIQQSKDRTSSLQERASFLESRIQEAKSRISDIESNIDQYQQKIDDQEQKVEDLCNIQVGPETALMPLIDLGHELGEGAGCETAKANLAIYRKTLEELKKAKSTWQNRVSTLQDELATVQEKMEDSSSGTDTTPDDGSTGEQPPDDGSTGEQRQVLVQYANSEEEDEARMVARDIAAYDGVTVVTRQQEFVEWSRWAGVVVLGGSRANPVMDELTNNTAINRLSSNRHQTWGTVRYQNTIVGAAAGAYAGDTAKAATKWLEDIDNFIAGVRG